MSRKVFLIVLIAVIALFTLFMVLLVINMNSIENLPTETELGMGGEIGVLAHNNVLDFYFYYPENFTLDKNAAMISVFIYDQDVLESDISDISNISLNTVNDG